MRRTLLTSLLLSFTVVTFAQKAAVKIAPTPANEYAAIDKKAMAIPTEQTHTEKDVAAYINANFSTDAEKVRAAYIWVATTLQYDVENMFAINFSDNKEDRLARAFAVHKGVCIDYANIFTDLCNLCGVKSYVVSGYNQVKGYSDYISHAWSVVLLDGEWYVFDPTWGSGYLYEKRFVSKIDEKYYKAQPQAIIKSHMPFDPLWQCLNYPITNAEFYEGKIMPNTSKPFFSYKDSIKIWELQKPLEQLKASARRIEANGVKNSMIYDRLFHIRQTVAYYQDSVEVTNYNTASKNYNDAVTEYNEFIHFRNNQFLPKKEDNEIRQMIDVADKHLAAARAKLDALLQPSAKVAGLKESLGRSIDEIQKLVDEQKDFVSRYLGKSKVGRALMFTNLGK